MVLSMRSRVRSKMFHHLTANPSTPKILFAYYLFRSNHRLTTKADAIPTAVMAVPDLNGPLIKQALTALELMCTVRVSE